MTMTAPDQTTRVELEPPRSWSIVWRGRTWREADQKGQHLALIALYAGRDDFHDLDVAAVVEDELTGPIAAIRSEEAPWRGHQKLMLAIMAFLSAEYEQDGSGDGVTRAFSEVAEASSREILEALRFD